MPDPDLVARLADIAAQRDALTAEERAVLLDALTASGGLVEPAAARLGWTEVRLRRTVAALGLAEEVAKLRGVRRYKFGRPKRATEPHTDQKSNSATTSLEGTRG